MAKNRIIVGHLVLAALILTAPLAAQSVQGSGTYLLRQLELWIKPAEDLSDLELTDSLFGLGYVNGVADAAHFELAICIPKKVSQEQILGTVLKFLTDHPERLHEWRYNLTYAALIRTFPCESENE